MAGNVQTDITGLRAENMPQYVALMNHAWVVAEIELGRWLPVESTAGTIVSPLAPELFLVLHGRVLYKSARIQIIRRAEATSF